MSAAAPAQASCQPRVAPARRLTAARPTAVHPVRVRTWAPAPSGALVPGRSGDAVGAPGEGLLVRVFRVFREVIDMVGHQVETWQVTVRLGLFVRVTLRHSGEWLEFRNA